MQEDIIASPIAYVAGTSLTCFIGVGICFLLKRIFRKRLGDVKHFAGLIIAAHLIAYTLFIINPHNEGTIENKTITAGLIVLALIPSLLLATIVGKPAAGGKPASKSANGLDVDQGDEKGEPEEELALPPLPEQPPSFGEGMVRGLCAFVAIWVFYSLYMFIFYVSIRAFDEFWFKGPSI